MKGLLVKALRAPSILVARLIDSVAVPVQLKTLGVEVGARCRFVGMPVFRLADGARICFGSDVLVNSRPNSNAATPPHPAAFSAIGSGALITVGDGSGVSGASIVAQTSVSIGRRVFVGSGACIWDTDFHPLDADLRRRHPTDGAVSRPIIIEDDVFIGARAILLKGVTIGRGAVVGAGAIVRKSVAAGDIVAGNPAQVVGSAKRKKESAR